jgi:hypothetical protein
VVTAVVAAVFASGTPGKYLQIYNCRVPLGSKPTSQITQFVD